MTPRLDPAQLDHAIRLYLSGESPAKIQATAGVSCTRLHRERLARGIPPRGHRVLPDDQIAAAYLNGASEFALAKQFNVSRGTIAKRLIATGVERRGSSQAGIVRAGKQDVTERRGQAAAAHAASRKRRVSMLSKQRRALNVEFRAQPASASEARLAGMLRARGVETTTQRAIGPYNVDIAALPVAVEVLGGGWHAYKASHRERTPHILDEGWHLVMVWDFEGRSALGEGAAEYLVTFIEKMRRQPAATCQYRVISGQGEVLTARGREDDEFPLVPPPRGRLDCGA